MVRAAVESLETRCLFSGGLVANGAPVALASVPGQFISLASCPIGQNLNLVTYAKSNVLKGIIVDASLNVVVPEFSITPQNQSVSQFGMAKAIRDKNNNAVIIYTLNSGFDLVRVDASGHVVNQPVALDDGSSFLQSPALAVANDNSVAVVYRVAGSGNGAPDRMTARVFDSNDSALFAPLTLSAASSNAPGGELLDKPSVIYVPADNDFLAAWSEEDLNQGITADIEERIEDRTFTSAGALGADPQLAVEPNGPTSDNVLQSPFVFLANQQPFVAWTRTLFGTAQQGYPYGGYEFTGVPVSSTGAALGTPATILSGASPAESFPVGVQVTGGNVTAFFNSGTGSFFQSTGGAAVTFSASGTAPYFNVLTTNTIATTAYQRDPAVPFSGNDGSAEAYYGNYYRLYDSATDTTTVTGQPTAYTAPAAEPVVVPPTVSITNGVPAANGLHFTLSVTGDPKSKPVTITVRTQDGTAKTGVNFTGLFETLTLPVGATSDVLIGLLDIPQFEASFTVNITSAPGATIGMGTGTGTILGSKLPPISVTVAAGQPASVTDSHGTVFVYKLAGPGKVTINRGKDGHVTETYSGTTDKSVLSASIAPSSTPKVSHVLPSVVHPNAAAASHFLVDTITGNSPIGAINIPAVDVAGNITLKGISTLTVGNLTGNNRVSLGAAKNAAVKFGNVSSTVLTAAGVIKSLTANSWQGGSITATSVAALTTTGDFDADVNVSTAGNISIRGVLGGGGEDDIRTIRAKASIGAISAASIAHEHIYAGAKTTVATLPALRSAFTNAKASIASITAHGFTDAIVAAPIITKINLTGLVSTNATPFGIAAEQITSYKRDTVLARNVFSKKLIDTAGQYTARAI